MESNFENSKNENISLTPEQQGKKEEFVDLLKQNYEVALLMLEKTDLSIKDIVKLPEVQEAAKQAIKMELSKGHDKRAEEVGRLLNPKTWEDEK